MVQGAAMFGIGLLLDLGGSDVRRAYTQAQGFGFARGAGLIYDLAGDDQYLLDNGDPMFGGDPLYPSAQRPTNSNASLGQGFGFGRRADTSDRAFMSGGIGILIDVAGADRYVGSVFVQGGGYWWGTGILADEAGDDHYDGMWYAMGTGAHSALGLLLDRAGNDVYGGTLPRVNVTIGGGHDLSAGFVIDEEGDDTYYGSRITLGSGYSNGMGFLIDNRGDDAYSANSPLSIGGAGLLETGLADPGSPRRKVKVIGIFIDAGGSDAYEVGGMTPATIGDGRMWTGAQSMDPAVRRIELGSGIDATGDSTLHF
jgi:hypothetical protein